MTNFFPKFDEKYQQTDPRSLTNPKQIIFNLLKTKDREKNLKSNQKIKTCSLKRNNEKKESRQLIHSSTSQKKMTRHLSSARGKKRVC